MASIEFTVSASPTLPARMGTLQTIILEGISEFKLTDNANRVAAFSLDGLSHRGTYIASHDTFTMRVRFPVAQRPDFDELIDSLKDWQIASFDAQDLPAVLATRNFTMTGDTWSIDEVGCTHSSVNIQGRFLA